MDAATVGVRLASSAPGPLVKRLFRTEPPGARPADRPVRLDALVALGAEKDALTPDDLRSLAGEITARGGHEVTTLTSLRYLRRLVATAHRNTVLPDLPTDAEVSVVPASR
ncbi:hypothetical protein ACL02R_00170 [Streptomyces sp. MS19]|uniref:NACHT N-terminal Helical domain 1-containing protein n=1 Tax=Streptomyces sp. MS19 TaxID=3385972 RepID=UPI0039A148E9